MKRERERERERKKEREKQVYKEEGAFFNVKFFLVASHSGKEEEKET